MPRREVQLCVGECYHLYNRGNNREPIFYERENYLFFLRRVRRYLAPVLETIAYCLMSTHYHLLIRVKTFDVSQTSKVSEEVSQAMMQLAVSYTKAMNKRYDRVGVLFQGPFRAIHVDQDSYLVHLSRYLHLNPVIAGLAEWAEEWEFSSYREYLGIRNGTLPEPEIVLSQFPSREAYREFVESYTAREREVIADFLFD
jgi:REP element-mobilizing transposase RayT